MPERSETISSVALDERIQGKSAHNIERINQAGGNTAGAWPSSRWRHKRAINNCWK